MARIVYAPTGGGGTQVNFTDAYIKTGNVTVPVVGSMTALAGFTLDIPAAVGDRVLLGAAFLWNPGADFLDWAAESSGVLVRFLSTGTSSAGFEGEPSWYAGPGTYRTSATPKGFTVQAGDLDAGSRIRFRMCSRGGGSGVLFANNDYPFYWRAYNYGPA